jgi:signal transduction histidine kinase
MYEFFRKVPLQIKLMLIGLIPFCFIVYLTVELYREKTEKLVLFDQYKEYLAESSNINGLIDALQEERKFSFDYAITKSMHDELVLQRPKTDAYIQKLVAAGDSSLTGFIEYTKLKQLEDIRNKVDSFKIGPNEVMHFYSNTVFRMNTLNTIPPANTAYLQPVYKDLMTQKILSEMNTYLGIIRSNVYNVLHTRQYMVETLIGTYGTYDIYNSYEAELLAKATPKIQYRYDSIKTLTAFKPTMEYINGLFKRFTFDSSYTAPEWWNVSNQGANELRKFQAIIWKGLDQKINGLYDQEYKSRTNTLIFLIVALFCVTAVISYIVYVINRTLRELKLAAERIAKGETEIQLNVLSKDVIGNLASSILEIDKNYQQLAQTSSAIGKGNFAVEVRLRSEKDALGKAILDMKKELQEYSERMEQLVAERTEDLARSNDDLQQFAHVASHDLKEPLRKISTFSNILGDEQREMLSEKGRVYLDKIQKASQRMASMIEGVLTYSTVGSNEPAFTKVDLNMVMEDVVNDLELSIIQKEAEVNYSTLPVVQGIPLLLHQLFYNLINNALKFSNNGVRPVITISQLPETKTFGKVSCIHIFIQDNGIGFNPLYADRIFNVFSRLNSKDKYEGTGLGLALCRKILQRHKGEIYAESQEGKGATFHILIPEQKQ